MQVDTCLITPHILYSVNFKRLKRNPVYIILTHEQVYDYYLAKTLNADPLDYEENIEINSILQSVITVRQVRYAFVYDEYREIRQRIAKNKR